MENLSIRKIYAKQQKKSPISNRERKYKKYPPGRKVLNNLLPKAGGCRPTVSHSLRPAESREV
jgi:hypothetical protein